MCRISSADCFISGFTASQSPLFATAKYSGLHFAHKPSVSLRICFQSFLPLWRVILIVICHCFTSRKTTKSRWQFSYQRLKTQVLSFNFCYIMHLRFVSVDKKIRAISVALNRLVLRTDFNPNYLIFSRFYLKNRITTKPTSKSFFFNDFNARRGIATPDYNSMVNDGNYTVRVHKRNEQSGNFSTPDTTRD